METRLSLEQAQAKAVELAKVFIEKSASARFPAQFQSSAKRLYKEVTLPLFMQWIPLARLLQAEAERDELKAMNLKMKQRNVINAIGRICETCGHEKNEDGCAHCITQELVQLRAELANLRTANAALLAVAKAATLCINGPLVTMGSAMHARSDLQQALSALPEGWDK